LICPAACRGEPILGGSKGVCPLGRRARVHAPPEKGRQGARTKFGRPLEGGTRSGSPSKLTEIEAADVGCGMGRYDVKLFQYLGERL